jgi:hypothetical protein
MGGFFWYKEPEIQYPKTLLGLTVFLMIFSDVAWKGRTESNR